MILGCDELANYHCGLQSLEVPVSSASRWGSSAHRFATDVSEKLGTLRSGDWCQLEPLSFGTADVVSVDENPASSEDKEEVSTDIRDSQLDSEEIFLHLVLPYSPCKDQGELEIDIDLATPVRSGTRREIPPSAKAQQFVSNGSDKPGTPTSTEWCKLRPLSFKTTDTVSVDERTASLEDKQEVTISKKDSRSDSEEIVLQLVLPCSPFKEQAELEAPASSCSRWENSAQHFVTKFSEQLEPPGVTNASKKLGPPRASYCCQLEALSLGAPDAVSVDERPPSLGDKKVASASTGDSRLDSEDIVLHLVLPYSPCKDEAELEFYKSQQKPVRVCSSCASEVRYSPEISVVSDRRDLNRMVRHDMICQQNLAHPDADVFVDLPVSHEHLDEELDAGSEGALEGQEMVETQSGLEMLKASVHDGASKMSLIDEKHGSEPLDGQDPRKCHPDKLQTLTQGNRPGAFEELEAKMPLNLGTHGLRSLMDTDPIQKFKRRRLTKPVDVLGKDVKLPSEMRSPDHDGDESYVDSESKRSGCYGSLCTPPDTDQAVLSSRSFLGSMPDELVGNDFPEPVTRIVKNRWGETGMGMADNSRHSDSAYAGVSRGSFMDRDMQQERDVSDSCISSSPKSLDAWSEPHGPKRREWLAQHHEEEAEATTTQSAHSSGFTGFVGGMYRYAIDNRPPAPHPGTVGDMTCVQLCKVCGEREDATTSLICDECEQVYHMTCVNSRMKIVPRVDEWYCRPCKKMKKHREASGELDLGAENRGWWREDAGIGKVERELMKMNNGKRTKVRIGPKFQAVVPDWNGIVEEDDLEDTLAESSQVFGQEVALTAEEKQQEQEVAEYNLAHNIWPKGWLPATDIPPNSKENWLQCMNVLFDEGDVRPDGTKVEKESICGKWRRAPLDVKHNETWECSCALVWDPRHADCAVPQELTDQEIQERLRFSAQIAQTEQVEPLG
ncbi:hypothetical protein R1sor_001398 [Riccia sorocarpa]|uniref:PHD-type domain-containing protein n=1 Tax=Riccia sorocarpa TaxID=122646 RepID=A0ABD3GXH1_9MARC